MRDLSALLVAFAALVALSCDGNSPPEPVVAEANGGATATEDDRGESEQFYEIIRPVLATHGHSIVVAEDGYLWTTGWTPHPTEELVRSVMRVKPEPNGEAVRVYPWSTGSFWGRLGAQDAAVYFTQQNTIAEFDLDGSLNREFTFPEAEGYELCKLQVDPESVVAVGESCRHIAAADRRTGETRSLFTEAPLEGGGVAVAVAQNFVFCASNEVLFKVDRATMTVASMSRNADTRHNYLSLVNMNDHLFVGHEYSLRSRLAVVEQDTLVLTSTKDYFRMVSPTVETTLHRLYFGSFGRGILSVDETSLLDEDFDFAQGRPETKQNLETDGHFAMDDDYFYFFVEEDDGQHFLVRAPRSRDGFSDTNQGQ